MDGDLIPGTKSLNWALFEQELAGCLQIGKIVRCIDVVVQGVVALFVLHLLHQIENQLGSTLLIKLTLSHEHPATSL